MSAIDRHWYHASVVSYLLWPFSWMYRLAVYLRRLRYRLCKSSVTHFPIPVIIVGNITVGGVGKTPFVAWLVNDLRAQGKKPGLVSRGYGGKAAQWPQAVTENTNPMEVGDEPVMLVQQTGCPMYVGPDRVAAVKALLAEHDCDVVISDDGLQHYALGRCFEIAIMDGERRLGNGFCLPAGPLREPASRLKSVDLVIVNGDALEHESSMQLVPGKIMPLLDNNTRALPTQQTVHAVAAIGHPQRFFATLNKMGFDVIPHAFPDHHFYTQSDITFDDDLPVIMTAKDAVKCQKIADSCHWYLPVIAHPKDGVRSDIKKIFS